MKIKIISLKDSDKEIQEIQDFIFYQIKNEYGYGYIANFHNDIIKLDKYYLNNKRNNLFLAINLENNDIMGTIAIREYDKNYNEFKKIYSKYSTASIWRLFVDVKYRRLGIGKMLVKKVEEFSKENNYNHIYLHTHKTLNGALEFWLSLNYFITIDTENEFKTVHMDKNISNIDSLLKINYKIPI